MNVWADTYRDGVRGKEAIVTEYARTVPTGSTVQDDFVGRMLWALGDKTGLPAKHFAEFDPLPSLEWLEPFTERRFVHQDLPLFNVQPNAEEDKGLSFSLAVRPTPYTHASWMAPVLPFVFAGRWDEVMEQIARWLARHLNDPKLLLWIAKNGGRLHPNFHFIISRALAERRQKGQPLSPPMQRLWRVALANRFKQYHDEFRNIYQWKTEFVRDGLSPAISWRFREALTPYVKISEPLRFPDIDGENVDFGAKEVLHVSDIVRWEIVLASDYVHSALNDLSDNEQWQLALRQLLPDLTLLLKDTLDLMSELEGANENHDKSYIDQPSISPHSQNQDFYDWTVLIDLTRNAWLETAKSLPDEARNEAKRWAEIPYPLFRRLAFFAAAQRPDILSPIVTIRWLLSNDRRWLWVADTRRESIRLLVAYANILRPRQDVRLQQAILQGPPHHIFRDDIEPERLQRIKDREEWLLLSKYQAAGAKLIPEASDRLQTLSKRYPEWQLADDDRDEFPFWMGGDDEWRVYNPTPKLRRDLEAWLLENPTTDVLGSEDDWAERCAGDFSRAATALFNLARQKVWPKDRWHQALQAWSTDALIERSWKYISRFIENIPDDELTELARPIAWWLQAIAKVVSRNEDTFFVLIRRILDSQVEEEFDPQDRIASQAINHPVGLSVQAVLRWWYTQKLQDGQGLKNEVAQILTYVSAPNSIGLRYGCVVLASNVIALYRVDREWTREHLLQYFHWDRSEIACGMWQSFLYSPRIYWPLLDVLKGPFLETAQHYDELGETLGRQYVALLTYAALAPDRTFRSQDFRAAIEQFTAPALARIAETLFRALEGAGDQKSEYLQNRIVPFMNSIWPNKQEAKTPEASRNFALLCAVAEEAFSEALMLFGDWLQPIDQVDYPIHLLEESQSCSAFPQESLDFLDRIIPDAVPWVSQHLRNCLNIVVETQPTLQTDQRYQRLDTLLRRHDQ